MPRGIYGIWEANDEKANRVRVRREREDGQLGKAQTRYARYQIPRVTSSGRSLYDVPLLGGTVQSPASLSRTPQRPSSNCHKTSSKTGVSRYHGVWEFRPKLTNSAVRRCSNAVRPSGETPDLDHTTCRP
jgi:hypothetical protein